MNFEFSSNINIKNMSIIALEYKNVSKAIIKDYYLSLKYIYSNEAI